MAQSLLQRATLNDIYQIRQLAEHRWRQYYPSIISEAQIDYMLQLMYSEKSLQEQMQKKKHVFYLVKTKSLDVGFISVHRVKKQEWFINKFYMDPDKASKGLGSKAFKELLEMINPQKISLTVNRQNFKAINFYFKNGFRIERVADFDIGNGFIMNDFVMTWKRK